MIDRLIEIGDELAALEAELEEADECGTLEDRLAIAIQIGDLESERFKLSMKETGGAG